MGSFNTTCFASQQTIASGDECYVLPIYQSSSYEPVTLHVDGGTIERHGITSSTCYPDAFWIPSGAFIEATYNDCGTVKVKNTAHNRIRMASLFETLYAQAMKVEAGSNRYHDPAYDVVGFIKNNTPLLHKMVAPSAEQVTYDGPMTPTTLYDEEMLLWEHTWDVAHEHRLFIRKNSWSPVVPMQFAIIHKVAYDQLIAEVAQGKTLNGESLEQEAFFRHVLSKATPDLKELFSTVEPSSITGRVARTLLWALGNFGEMEAIRWSNELLEMSQIAGSYVKDENFDQAVLFSKMKPMLDARYVAVGLSMHNIKITPLVYAGQDYDNSVGKGYAAFVNRVSKSVTQERQERYS